MRPLRCHRLLCRHLATVLVGRHAWCARHGLEQKTEIRRAIAEVTRG